MAMYTPTMQRRGSRQRMAEGSTLPSRGDQDWESLRYRESTGVPPEKRTSIQGDPEDQASSSQEQPLGAYVMIAPNINKRNQLQRVANKELEDLERWKEQHRPGPIYLMPQRLGGSGSEAEVRQKQQMRLMQCKYQQKQKREEYGRRQKEAEEAELLKMKAIQREKANKLEEKKRQEEKQRRVMLDEDYYFKTTELLSRLDMGLPKRNSCQTANCAPESTAWARNQAYKQAQREEENEKLQAMKAEQRRKGELLELKRKQEESERRKVHHNEQRRVNNAFLDRLQGGDQPGGIHQYGRFGSMDYFGGDSWESTISSQFD
uniref:Epithelial stromal interaction 1 n=1 Tax=Sphenodon punctatus TaxID=8508 RepID=A0A8D0L5H3_SPHPU